MTSRNKYVKFSIILKPVELDTFRKFSNDITGTVY